MWREGNFSDKKTFHDHNILFVVVVGGPPFHDHTLLSVVVEGGDTYHDHTVKSVVVVGALSTTTCKSVVVKRLSLDSYLHVMPPRFLSTTNISFLCVTYGREKPIF